MLMTVSVLYMKRITHYKLSHFVVSQLKHDLNAHFSKKVEDILVSSKQGKEQTSFHAKRKVCESHSY